MTTNTHILDMLGEDLKTAVVDAQGRLSDTTIMARCDEGLWRVERADASVATGLTYDQAIEHVRALA